MDITFVSGDCSSLTNDEQHRLAEVVRDRDGSRLTRSRFHEAVLHLFEDIPGLERLTPEQCRGLLESCWRRYQIQGIDGTPSEGSRFDVHRSPTLRT